jgi:hypothetical protein
VDAGREELCELSLPGSLVVNDGPSRFWYSEGHPGEEGSYRNGRKVGKWRECDRFGRCRDQMYELISAAERGRGAKAEVPVTFVNGEYVFDFASCWSTSVTYRTASASFDLNIGGGALRCGVAHIPQASPGSAGRLAGFYSCRIPSAVGVRVFRALDLRSELPKVGLPQFCGPDETAVTMPTPDGPVSEGFSVKTSSQGHPLANSVDVECAAIMTDGGGPPRLTVRLNTFAEALVLEYIAQENVRADSCAGRFPLSPLPAQHDTDGRSLFVYGLSPTRTTALRQQRCLAASVPIRTTCGG